MTDDTDDTNGMAGVTSELVAIPVSDEITLDGILWTPPGEASETAIALSHGTGAAFYYPLLTWLGPRLAAMGYPTLSLNRRDHSQFFGYYTLSDASMDHANAIDLLCGRGARRVVPVGHSYGTVTAPFYVARTDDARVPALVLLSALGDLRTGSMRMAGGQEPYDRLVAEGYQVAVLDVDEAGLDTLVGEHGDRVSVANVDVSDYPAVSAAISGWASAGDLWGLVNNAGWDRAQRFVDTEPAFWRQVIDLNLYGPLNATHAMLPYLSGAGGRVVSIASDAGRVGSSGEAVYSAAKGGTIALMKTLAREHARDAVTFNTICPGPTDTALLAGFDESGRLQEALQRSIPMRRLARPDDFPGLVAYFLSDEAGYVTGQTISVSGGLSMHG